MSPSSPVVHCIFHEDTSTCTYIVKDASSHHAMIIDPVMDYNPANGRTSQTHNDKVVAYCQEHALQVDYIIETHVHADHMTGAAYLKLKFPLARTVIGEHVKEVQALFRGVFNLKDSLIPDGSQFDMLLHDGQEFALGNTAVKAWHTPGHTPACMNLVVGDNDAVFTGDTLFLPDMGTARCDFPGGSVEDLYQSIQRLYRDLPDTTRVFVGHDYAPGGREVAWETTLGIEKTSNKQIKGTTTLEEFTAFRQARDAQLDPPKLIVPSLQINLRNGAFPPPEDNGTVYLKMPLNVLGK